MQQVFTQETDFDCSFLGGLIRASHSNGYSFSDCKYDESSSSLDISIVPPDITSSGSTLDQTAFVLGGVVEYYER